MTVYQCIPESGGVRTEVVDEGVEFGDEVEGEYDCDKGTRNEFVVDVLKVS
jgi:hypothetical protein